MERTFSKLPQRTALTALLSRLSPAARLRQRRRIEALASDWSDRLVRKYGEGGALAVCRRRLAYCVNHAPGLREQVWLRVYSILRPPDARRDSWVRGDRA